MSFLPNQLNKHGVLFSRFNTQTLALTNNVDTDEKAVKRVMPI